MVNDARLQIRLPKSLRDDLDALALEQEFSDASAFVRFLIMHTITKDRINKAKRAQKDQVAK